MIKDFIMLTKGVKNLKRFGFQAEITHKSNGNIDIWVFNKDLKCINHLEVLYTVYGISAREVIKEFLDYSKNPREAVAC